MVVTAPRLLGNSILPVRCCVGRLKVNTLQTILSTTEAAAFLLPRTISHRLMF